jgi:predicted house-cleaning NTP pyrophosphatase (Maf/HAM1 superfamily)
LYVLENARKKGEEVVSRLGGVAAAGTETPSSDFVVISADTVVVLERTVLEKPKVTHDTIHKAYYATKLDSCVVSCAIRRCRKRGTQAT